LFAAENRKKRVSRMRAHSNWLWHLDEVFVMIRDETRFLKLRSYGATMKIIGNVARQETSRWLNKRAENSHLPFRR